MSDEDESNPFMVDLPPAGERLDLSPIVLPLLHALRKEMMDHELRCHWGNGPKKIEPLLPEEMYAYMVRANEGVEYDRILNLIDRSSIVAFLKKNDFKPDGPAENYFTLYGSDKVWVYGPRDVMNYIKKHDAVYRISRAISKTLLDTAKDIEAASNVLDRIAARL